MLRKPRGRFGIVVALLMALADGIQKQTRIQYHANLNLITLREYFEKLENAELIIVKELRGSDIRTKKTYFITPKGRDFLKEAKKTLATLEEIFKEEK